MSKLIRYAKELEENGCYEEALNYLEMAIDEKGCPFDIRKDIGQILNKTRQYGDALNCFDLVLSMDENHTDALFGRAISLIGLNRWVDAYNSFVKLVKIDKNNANCWYYIAIILKEYDKNESAEKYFEYFKKFDNNDFAKIRSYYEFGLIFKQREMELYGTKRNLNIAGFQKELNSYGLSNDEIEFLLHTIPYEDLLFEMYCLKDYYKDNLIKETVKQHLGLNDEDIIRMFELESPENIKQSVISILGYNPFKELDDEINIPLYEKSGLFKFIDNHKTENYSSIFGVSNFNRFVDIMEAKNFNRVSHTNIRPVYKSDLYYVNVSNAINLANDNFIHAKKAIVKKNYHDAFIFLDTALNACPGDYYNIYNIKFYYSVLLSRFKSPNHKLLAYKCCEDISNKFKYFKNKDVFLLNKACLSYDLSLYYYEFIEEAICNLNQYIDYKGENEDIKYLSDSLEMMKIK